MQVRVRGPSGQSTIKIDDTATVAELVSTIAEKTGLPEFDLKYGFPPQPLDLHQFDMLTLLCDTGLKLHGEQITVLARESASSAATPQTSSQSQQSTASSSQRSGGQQESSQQGRTSTGKRDAESISRDPPTIPVPSRAATMVLRVMPDDNSCFFRAFGTAVLGPDLDTVTEMRSMVAQAVQADPEKYTKAVLDDQDPNAYCEWIQMENSWGGYIEMGILSQSFGVEICTVDVKTQNVTRINDGHGFSKVILIYSGIHYDTIALTRHGEADQTQFEADDYDVVVKAQEMCKELARHNYYFDAMSSGYSCKTCGWHGGYEAMSEHVAKTGHTDMVQVGAN